MDGFLRTLKSIYLFLNDKIINTWDVQKQDWCWIRKSILMEHCKLDCYLLFDSIKIQSLKWTYGISVNIWHGSGYNISPNNIEKNGKCELMFNSNFWWALVSLLTMKLTCPVAFRPFPYLLPHLPIEQNSTWLFFGTRLFIFGGLFSVIEVLDIIKY